MTKEMRELQAKLATVEQEARLAIGEGRVEDAEKGMEKIRSLRKQIAMLEELETEEKRAAVPMGEARERKELEEQYTKAVLKAIRRKSLSPDEQSTVASYQREVLAQMHEGGVPAVPDGDVGIIVPVDVQTRINEIQRTLNDLSGYVKVETVGTLSGSRVLERDELMTPLQVVAEYGQIQEMDNPQFDLIQYTLIKRAGFLPLTNELLADSDQNILAYVSNWIARKVVVTRNTLITQAVAALQQVPLADLDAIKHVLNVDLDPAISKTAEVLTNQDGFHWLDTQVDGNGRYLLQDDITQPGRKLLFGRPICVGANLYLASTPTPYPTAQIIIVNRYLASTPAPDATAPIIIGNGKQLAVLFTRGRYELASTKEGGDAWRRDATEMRVISRDDLQQWDPAAAVHGRLAI